MNQHIRIGVEQNHKTEPPESGFFFNRKLGSSDRAVLRHRPEVAGHNHINPAGSLTDVVLTQGSHVFLPVPTVGAGLGDGRVVRVLSRGASTVECDAAIINGQYKCVKFAGRGTCTLISESGEWLVLSDHGAVFV